MSTAVATEARRYTPEELLALPDEKSYELVNGELVERNMGAESSEIGGNLFFLLRMFCREQNRGIVWPADNGFQCFRHAPGMVRRPDVSFVKRGRLPGDVSPKGWVRIPPTWPSRSSRPTIWPENSRRSSTTTARPACPWCG